MLHFIGRKTIKRMEKVKKEVWNKWKEFVGLKKKSKKYDNFICYYLLFLIFIYYYKK